ncbi:Autophagy-related protein [Quillaja saponaria]|uniref:Autophagy-related protein n=1 Tax=Quillaja saponaria TaxID=32244 RepID=A0AAD7LXH8_QUISA|nr:Autophagy-related protein [Quillaja saponaria]
MLKCVFFIAVPSMHDLHLSYYLFFFHLWIKSQGVDGKNPSEFSSRSLPIGRKSQDAAVGVLVHMLRTAPPLRQDPSCYSSHSLKTEVEAGVATASGFFMPRKVADALEDLRSHRELKDLLLSKSGNRVLSKDES